MRKAVLPAVAALVSFAAAIAPAQAQVDGVAPVDALAELLTYIESEVAGRPDYRTFTPALAAELTPKITENVRWAQIRGYPVAAKYVGPDRPQGVNGYAFQVQYRNERLVWRVYYNADRRVEGIWFDRTDQTPTGAAPRGKYAILCEAFRGVKGC